MDHLRTSFTLIVNVRYIQVCPGILNMPHTAPLFFSLQHYHAITHFLTQGSI